MGEKRGQNAEAWAKRGKDLPGLVGAPPAESASDEINFHPTTV